MDSEKILSRLVQIGTVSDVDNSKRRARVILKETGHTSGWLCVLATPPFIPDYDARNGRSLNPAAPATPPSQATSTT